MWARRNGAARSADRSSATSCSSSPASSGWSRKRNWSRNFPLRPEFNYATASEESAWNTLWRVDHQLNAEPHLGVPLAARDRAAIQSSRRHAGNARELRRRDRPRSNAGRHADLGALEHESQHRARRRRARRHGARQPRVARARSGLRALRAVSGRMPASASSTRRRVSTTRRSTARRRR